MPSDVPLNPMAGRSRRGSTHIRASGALGKDAGCLPNPRTRPSRRPFIRSCAAYRDRACRSRARALADRRDRLHPGRSSPVPPRRCRPRPPGPEVALVHDFYTAVNGVLATGSANNLGDLTDIVADTFVEHPHRPGTSPGRAGLIEMLTAVRLTRPAMRIVVEDVRSDGDQVAARVRVEGAGGAFLGIPLEAPRRRGDRSICSGSPAALLWSTGACPRRATTFCP